MPENLPTPKIPQWRRAFSRCLDFLYPPTCEICSEPLIHGRALCDTCAADLPRLLEPFCNRCGEMFDGAIDGPFTCPNCKGLKFSFEFARPALVRDERTLDLIHRLKYKREIHLARELGILAVEAFADPRFETALKERWPLIPVPIHRKRQRHRHFNQAGEISLTLAKLTGLPVLKALERTRETITQTRLSRRERMENLRSAFAITRHGQRWLESCPHGAIIVDDVLTTGSTVNECSKTLRKAGFEKIFAITVMRG
jgi:ComF family protein